MARQKSERELLAAEIIKKYQTSQIDLGLGLVAGKLDANDIQRWIKRTGNYNKLA